LTTLYIRHPSKAEGEGALCNFAVAGDNGAIEQTGVGALRQLADLVAAARRVVLIVSAADVTVLAVQAPPLSGARLKAALPALVEEDILGDPAEAVLVAGPQLADQSRPVAVVQRDWLEPLVRILLSLGARAITALPAQLCLPLQPGSVTAAMSGGELTLRQSQFQGFGLALDGGPVVALQTVRALAGDAPLVLYVPQEQLGEYQALAAEAGPGITLEADAWPHWISGAKSTNLDLVPGLGAAGAAQRDWAQWRWPIRLGLLVLLINLVGLNVQWLRLRGEANALRQNMTQTFRSAYPNQPVIDPVAQMRQNLARAKANTGELSHDEFNYLAAAFGEATRSLARQPGISSIEYKEHGLIVKVKSETVDPGLIAQLKAALGARGMGLEETAPATWLVRTTGART
jgi:general secretion pathway protein L